MFITLAHKTLKEHFVTVVINIKNTLYIKCINESRANKKIQKITYDFRKTTASNRPKSNQWRTRENTRRKLSKRKNIAFFGNKTCTCLLSGARGKTRERYKIILNPYLYAKGPARYFFVWYANAPKILVPHYRVECPMIWVIYGRHYLLVL